MNQVFDGICLESDLKIGTCELQSGRGAAIGAAEWQVDHYYYYDDDNDREADGRSCYRRDYWCAHNS